jgi:hypothetical protein
MHRNKTIASFLLICALAVIVQAQDTTIEYGDTSELRGVTKIFIDTKSDLSLRKVIGMEIHKKLPKLEIVSKPEEADVHVRFFYEKENYLTGQPSPTVGITSVPVGLVEKVLSKDRVRVLMSSRGYRPSDRIKITWGVAYPPYIDFAREFVKAYLAANA